jgi:hypothetical protein
VHHAPLVRPAAQPVPPRRHELSAVAPTAPPNPTPLPQASKQPNPQPTAPTYDVQPERDIPAVPTAVPSVGVQTVAVRIPPTAAPTPVPSASPTAAPTPRPVATLAPTAKPQTPAPAAPTASPTPAAVAAARPTTAPTATPGAPSPSPTQAPASPKPRPGLAPTPGPKGSSTPGPRAGTEIASKGAQPRPVTIRPTPTPAPRRSAPPNGLPAIDVNAKLRALLPHNDVNPQLTSVHERITLQGSMDPTPPPEVLAQTKYLYEERGTGSDAGVKMWVTGTHRSGPLLICDGWMLRYPVNENAAYKQGTFTNNVPGGIVISTGGLSSGVLPPVIEEHASTPCSAKKLTPFAPSPGPSP